MINATRFRMKPYIKPFEKALALEELEQLSGAVLNPSTVNNDGTEYTVNLDGRGESVVKKLAYWEAYGEGEKLTPQVIREASVAAARNGKSLEEIISAHEDDFVTRIPRRRSLRYGTHGIHEYRGKFFPQLVRALINISGIEDHSAILDPMCGSGTTIVEAITEGHRGIGFDMNPLSVFVSNVKCKLLFSSPKVLIEAFEQLERALETTYATNLPRLPKDNEYLNAWFASEVLAELDQIVAAIASVGSQEAQDLFRVALSNVLRSLSYQKEADLRVRREEKSFARGSAFTAFRAEALKSTKSVIAYLRCGGLETLGCHEVLSGDARSFAETGAVPKESVDLVITSPPYATALPYLDTDRLSLIYLGLLPRTSHRARDTEMIGNREVTERGRRELWSDYEEREAGLPESVKALVARISDENSAGKVGFRRKNLPALLGRYFLDMRQVLSETYKSLKPNGTAFFVVGNNRTNTPFGEVEIRTAQLLGEIAEAVGFERLDTTSMDMLSSRDLFSKNQTPSEHIIRLRKSVVAETAR